MTVQQVSGSEAPPTYPILAAARPEPPTVVARCLGHFRLEIRGRPVAHWRAGKARALFLYLLINRGQLIYRDRLHDVLWPTSDDRRSSSLKVAAHAVRRVLADVEEHAGLVLVHQDHGYMLCAGDTWVDAEEFERSFERGRAAWAAKEHDRAIEWFQRTVSLYQGEFLAGESGDWIAEHRLWMRGIALRALSVLRTDALEQEDWPLAMHWCRRTLALDLYHEETYQTLMMMHGELGELGRVREWYDLCRHRMRTGLGIDPTERTERILTTVLRGGPHRDLTVSAPEVVPRARDHRDWHV